MNSARLQECISCPLIVVFARAISSELRRPKVGLKECSCLVSSCVLGVALSATNDGIYRLFSDGRPSQTRGDNAHKKCRWLFRAKECPLRIFRYYAHSTGANSRTICAALMSAGLFPHDKQTVPTRLKSLSLEISVSRVPNDPAMTGPAHLSQT